MTTSPERAGAQSDAAGDERTQEETRGDRRQEETRGDRSQEESRGDERSQEETRGQKKTGKTNHSKFYFCRNQRQNRERGTIQPQKTGEEYCSTNRNTAVLTGILQYQQE
ncbi:uncharacterized protein V6R79_011709 [Siganus canaliculatus]